MAMELMDEHEQGERVRQWLRENGSAIVGGVALGLAAVVGYQWWGQSKIGHRADASAQYAALEAASDRGERDGVEKIAASLAKDFADTPYAALANLQLAELQHKAGEFDAALSALRRAEASTTDAGLKELIASRVARVELAAGRPEQALTTLAGVTSEGFEAIREDLRGDALAELGRRDESVAAYRKAHAAYQEGLPGKRLVEMKLAGLGAKVEADA
ncbi:MAG: tetratricopeptide repeat protein [Xanthomonadales bacterium]|nr:tetratricopeptide repeat protein [Xanthomonadales bacterium]